MEKFKSLNRLIIIIIKYRNTNNKNFILFYLIIITFVYLHFILMKIKYIGIY